MKILIVDDEREIVELLRDRAVSKKHSVDTAYNGKAALDIIKQNNHDLIFLDHNMPGLTGLELLKYVKENNLRPKIAIITGYEEIDELFMRRMGADEFLTKPLKMKDIDHIIDKYARLIKKFRDDTLQT
ncbi:MAG: response regulator [Candidatus Omnitrophica bacterium]|nr:response regulator [Candidatus Omnitrophota bacterium]